MDDSPTLLTAHFWLRPRLHELLTSIAGGPYRFDPRDSIGLLARQCLQRNTPPAPTERFIATREQFAIRITFEQSRRYGVWVAQEKMIRFENMVQHLFDQMLFSYVQAKIGGGEKQKVAVRAFMDEHDIDAAHTDYLVLNNTVDRLRHRRQQAAAAATQAPAVQLLRPNT